MKFEVRKTSDWNYRKQIDIKTLKELMEFVNDNGQIIITPYNPIVNVTGGLPSIEIYDDWRE